MSKYALLLLAAFSLNAMACPNMQGSWSCSNPETGNLAQPMFIMQQSVGGQTSYMIQSPRDTQNLVSDGQDHTQTDPQSGMTVTNNATCASETRLTTKVNMKSVNPPATITGTMDFELRSPNSIVMTADVIATINGQTQHSKQTATCTKN